jgi:hypothetical protein
MAEHSHSRPLYRACNIILRTAHIGACSVAVGGHFFGVAPERIFAWACATALTGAALMIVEAYPSWRYFCEGRGLMVLAKLILLGLVPLAWSARVPILFAVIVIGSIGAHMPRRYRHLSILEQPALDQDR